MGKTPCTSSRLREDVGPRRGFLAPMRRTDSSVPVPDSEERADIVIAVARWRTDSSSVPVPDCSAPVGDCSGRFPTAPFRLATARWRLAAAPFRFPIPACRFAAGRADLVGFKLNREIARYVSRETGVGRQNLVSRETRKCAVGFVLSNLYSSHAKMAA